MHGNSVFGVVSFFNSDCICYNLTASYVLKIQHCGVGFSVFEFESLIILPDKILACEEFEHISSKAQHCFDLFPEFS